MSDFVRKTTDIDFGIIAPNGMGLPVDDTTPPNLLVPTTELPVIGVRPPDRKWWLDSFIAELDVGQFTNSGRLADGMKRDARIMGCLEQRNAGVFGAPLELEPSAFGAEVGPDGKAGESTDLAKKIRDEILQGWEKMFPRAELEKLNEYAVIQGIGIAEKYWDTSTKPWTFTIDVRHPQFYLWIWNTGCYHLITLNRSLIRVPRRSSQFIVHTPYGYKNAFLAARVRALVDPWMMSQWSQTDWARWCEVNGSPMRKAIVPQQTDPKEEKKFVSEVAGANAETTIKVRRDADGNMYDMEFIEANGLGWKGFEGMLAWCDAKKAEVLLGQSMSMDGQGGLNSQEDPGAGVRLDVKTGDATKLCETLYTQALREYCEYNYGNPDLAPRPSYVVMPPEDKGELAKRDVSIGQALVAFQQCSAPIDVRKWLEQNGYPLLTEQQCQDMKDEADAKDAADQAAQRDHDMALMKTKKGVPDSAAPAKDDGI